MRLPIILLAIPVIALALFGASTPPSASATDCGPHSHWIDDCPAGTDSLANTSALVELDEVGDDCVGDMTVNFSGPTDIVRQAPSDVSAKFGGVGSIDTHLDVIDTEIVSMSLTGGGLTLKAGTSAPSINAGVSQSLGATEEQAADATQGDNFFDVFFEISDGTDTYYNQSALRIKAVILEHPPVPIHPPAPIICLDLFSAPSGGFDTGTNLVDFQFDPDPPPVGGIAEVLVGGGEAPASTGAGSGSSALLYAALAGAVAAGALAIAAAGWYARRRWLR